MNRNYLKGRRFEYRVKEYLEKEGYVVFRCAGSKPLDLIAFKKPGMFTHTQWECSLLFVECKAAGARLPKEQRYELIELAAKCGARLILATTRGRYISLKGLE